MNRRQFIIYSGSALIMAGEFSMCTSLEQLKTIERKETSAYAVGLEAEIADIYISLH